MILFIIILTILAVLILMTALAGSAADYNQAQAAIEAARAAQVAAAGQTLSTVSITILAVMLALTIIAAAAIIAWLLIRQKRLENIIGAMQENASSRWAPGPNARWGRIPAQHQKQQLDPETVLAILQAQAGYQSQQMPPQIPAQTHAQPSQPPTYQW